MKIIKEAGDIWYQPAFNISKISDILIKLEEHLHTFLVSALPVWERPFPENRTFKITSFPIAILFSKIGLFDLKYFLHKRLVSWKLHV